VNSQLGILDRLGIVVIGRNEGERLRMCLRSLIAHAADCPIVYVDSGSTDGSQAFASSLRVKVVELDMSVPFSAARARNAGFQDLLVQFPDIVYVQFLDGDCLLVQDWLTQGAAFLDSNLEYGVACGRRRERFPRASIYNRLIDMEWNTSVGPAKACGGDALFRVSAFQEVGGFNPSVIAGEEPDLCLRLRQQGWKVMRLDAEMTLHDADMHRFGQWFRRTKRGGFAYAMGAAMHRQTSERHWVRETRSALVWGLAIPALILILAVLSKGWGLLLFAVYPLQVARIARGRQRLGESRADAWLYGLFCVLAKLAEAAGAAKFYRERYFGQQAKIMEYK